MLQFDKGKLQKTRVAYLVIGALALLFLGLVYAWSIFATPLQEVYGWSREALSITFSISMIMFCIGGIVSSVIAAKTSAKVSMITAAVLMSAGFALTALLAPKGIVAVYVCYGVLVGTGCGFGYNAIISTVNMWFQDRVGFASGVLMMGFGLGALVLGIMADKFIVSLGLTATLYILAVIAIVILGLAAAVLKLPPEGSEQVFMKKETGKHVQEAPIKNKSYSPSYMVKSLIFVLYLLWFVTVTSTGLTLIGDSKQGALLVGVAASTATLLVGLVSTTNGVSRIIMGSFCDRFGLTKTMVLITVACLVATVLLIVAFIGSIPALYIVGALCMGFSFGGIPVMSSSFAMNRFGPKYYSTNFAIANACIIPSSLLSSAIAPMVRSVAGDAMVYVVFAVLVAIGFGFLFIFQRKYKKEISAA